MTNIIAPPTLEELNERIVAIEDLRNTWRDLPSKTPFDIELYCLYAVRDGVAASEQSLSEAERHAVEHARWQVRKATPDNPDCCFDYQLVKNLLDVIDRKNPQSPWMDIETAPKDGTKIDVWIEDFKIKAGKLIKVGEGHRITDVYWGTPYYGDDRKFDKEWVIAGLPWTEPLESERSSITGWMPLPAPPTHNSPPEERQCQKCGCATEGEEAWVDGKIWCHPCADETSHNHGEGDPDICGYRMPDSLGGEQ